MILPDQKYKGQTNASDMLTRLIYSVVKTGLAPYSFYELDKNKKKQSAHYSGVPVNILAEIITNVYSVKHDQCKVFHAINYLNDGVSLDQFVDWIESAGNEINRFQDFDEWYSRMETKLQSLPNKEKQHSALDILMAYGKPWNSGPSFIGANNFQELIKTLKDIDELPPFSENYIHKYLKDIQLLGML